MFGIVGLEVLLLVLLVVGIIIIVMRANYSTTEQLVNAKEAQIEIEREKLKIAEKKYMQGKIKKDIFMELKSDIIYKMILSELDIFRIRKAHTLEIEEKAQKIINKIVHPTRHKESSIRHKLAETEIIRKEIKFVEKKLLRNEIDQNLFKRIVSEKEDEMIEKENEIIHIVKEM
jgi:hypothetical protein